MLYIENALVLHWSESILLSKDATNSGLISGPEIFLKECPAQPSVPKYHFFVSISIFLQLIKFFFKCFYTSAYDIFYSLTYFASDILFERSCSSIITSHI